MLSTAIFERNTRTIRIVAIVGLTAAALVGANAARADAGTPYHQFGPLTCQTTQSTIGTIRTATSTAMTLQAQDGAGESVLYGDGTGSDNGYQWIYYRLLGYSYTKNAWYGGPIKRVFDSFPEDGMLPEQWDPNKGWILAANFDDQSLGGPNDAFLHPPVGGWWKFEIQTYWEPLSGPDVATVYNRTTILQNGIQAVDPFVSSVGNSARSAGFCYF